MSGLVNRTTLYTPEMRALLDHYGDPLTLNFKLMIDWNCPYGLFAPEENINSALAYLKRIGEENRYWLLKQFISQFQDFIRLYDYLILGVEGIGEIIGRKPGTWPNNDDDWKLTFTVRETIDFRLQSLLYLYRQIWYDNIREVEVLPSNLRRFNCSVLVYSSGYFHNVLYGMYEGADENDPELKVLPTINKLQQVDDQKEIKFNHVIVYCNQCMINNEESGKSMFEDISNEMNSEFVKNKITFNYRLCSYGGMFYNTIGDLNVNNALIALSAVNSYYNQKPQSFDEIKSKFVDSFKSNVKKSAQRLGESTVRRGLKIGQRAVASLDAKMGGFFSKVGKTINVVLNPDKYLEGYFRAGEEFLKTKVFGAVDKFYDGQRSGLEPFVTHNAIELNFNLTPNMSETDKNIQLETDIQSIDQTLNEQKNIEYQEKINETPIVGGVVNRQSF